MTSILTNGFSRRRWLSLVGGVAAGACTSVTGTSSSGPGVCSVPSKGTATPYCLLEASMVRAPKARLLSVGQTMLMKVDDQTAVLVMRDTLGFYALSAICTHACCVLSICREADCRSTVETPQDCGATPPSPAALTTTAICPCHGSVFALTDGNPINGPAVTPLPAYAVSFDGDDVLVDTGTIALVSDRASG